MRYRLFIFCYGFSFLCFSQQKVELPKVLLPSPDAAALGKYGDVPVSYQTGIPSINIPLYEIKTSRLTLPVSLSYHSGGFRVNEIASNTGLGWTLQAGASISRVVKSFPDESDQGILRMGLTTYEDVLNNKDRYWLEMTQACRQGTDVESDEYNYSLPNESGKFIYDVNKQPFLIPYKAIKVQYDLANSSYKITDEHGVIYKFNEREKTTAFPCSDNLTQSDYTTAWYLTTIVSADGTDSISIEYEDKQFYYDYQYSYTEEFGNRYNDPSILEYNSHNKRSSVSATIYYPKVIKKITYKNGMMEFSFSQNRKDIGSGAGPKLDEIIVYQKNANGTFSAIKRYGLEYGYFCATDSNDTDPLSYRLKLEKVMLLDRSNQVIGKYELIYNDINLPKRNSNDRDMWGFYNGYKNNLTLVRKTTTRNSYGALVQIGTADRDPSGDYIQACMLKRIYYPTGGYTEYDFEPHKINYTYTQALEEQWISLANAAAVGTDVPSQNLVTSTFTVNRDLNSKMIVFVSRYGYEGVTQMPKVTFQDVTANTTQVFEGYLTQDNSKVVYPLTLQKDHTYQITAEAYQSQQVYAQISVSYREIDQGASVINIVSAGGMRIASIKNYDYNNSLIQTQEYKYGQNEDGIGTLLIPDNLGQFNYSIRDYELIYPQNSNTPSPQFCGVKSYTLKIFPGSAVHDFINFGGSTVLYDLVTKYDGVKTDNNGKSVYHYDIYKANVHLISMYYNLGGLLPINRNWQNGYLKLEQHFKSQNNQFVLIKSQERNYDFVQSAPSFGLVVGEKRTRIYHQPCNIVTNEMAEKDRYFWSEYPIYGGKVLLTTESSTTFDATGLGVTERTTYAYENPTLLQPTKIDKVNSTGQVVTIRNQYPQDISSGLTAEAEEARTQLISKHILTPVLQKSYLINDVQKEVVRTNYKIWPNGIASAANVEVKYDDNPLEPKLQFHAYDEQGNILEQSLSNNVRKTYIWGYRGEYPIAEITGASIGTESSANTSISTIVLQNFSALSVTKSTALRPVGVISMGASETSVVVNFGIGYNPMNDPQGLPAYLRKVELVFKNRSGGAETIVDLPAPTTSAEVTASLSAAATYDVYFRSQYVEPLDLHINSITKIRTVAGVSKQIFHTSFEEEVENISSEARTGKVSHAGVYDILYPKQVGSYILSWWEKIGSDGWIYKEETLTATNSSTNVRSIGTNNSLVDEVRLYPKGSQMTTYTYDPQIGIMTITDVNNNTVYYEYDSFNRLKLVKDSNGKIVKAYQYHYRQ